MERSQTAHSLVALDQKEHDGAEMTADDVKATFDRIVKPPQGISIPRSILFKAVSEINARDKYTVEFKLPERREDILHHAYRLARANAGAPGVDEVTFAQIEERGLEAWLAGLREELVSTTYRPDPVRAGRVKGRPSP